MSKTLQRNLLKKIPNGSNEWDSSDEEDDAPVVPKRQTKVKSTKSSKGGKTVKYDGKIQTREHDDDDDNEEKNLVLYVGHIPKDFEEIDLRRFLSQFGKVYNCRVARKVETGQPKGFAFVRFGDDETAKIACDTLHGYFLEKQRLVCQLRPSHPGMFFDTGKNIDDRKKKTQLEAKKRNRNLANSEKLKEITSRLVSREMKKRDRLKALGIDYDFPGYKTNQADFENEFVPGEEVDEAEADESSKKKRRKESMNSTTSEGSATKKKKEKKKDSIDSRSKTEDDGANDTPSKKEKKKKTKKKRSSLE